MPDIPQVKLMFEFVKTSIKQDLYGNHVSEYDAYTAGTNSKVGTLTQHITFSSTPNVTGLLKNSSESGKLYIHKYHSLVINDNNDIHHFSWNKVSDPSLFIQQAGSGSVGGSILKDNVLPTPIYRNPNPERTYATGVDYQHSNPQVGVLPMPTQLNVSAAANTVAGDTIISFIGGIYESGNDPTKAVLSGTPW